MTVTGSPYMVQNHLLLMHKRNRTDKSVLMLPVGQQCFIIKNKQKQTNNLWEPLLETVLHILLASETISFIKLLPKQIFNPVSSQNHKMPGWEVHQESSGPVFLGDSIV